MTDKTTAPEGDGKYLVINAVTRRARDLAKGARPTLPYAEGNFDPMEVAMEEYQAGNLVVRRRLDLDGTLEELQSNT